MPKLKKRKQQHDRTEETPAGDGVNGAGVSQPMSRKEFEQKLSHCT